MVHAHANGREKRYVAKLMRKITRNGFIDTVTTHGADSSRKGKYVKTSMGHVSSRSSQKA